MKKKIKKIYNYLVNFINEEYKYIMFCMLLVIFMLFPLDYYIYLSGDISNINSRIKIEDSYKEKGSFNISYVTEMDATIVTYLLSFIVPDWKSEKVDNYKIDKKDNIKNIEFRDKLSLDNSLNNAMYWGYTLAGEKISKSDKKIFVIYKFDESPNDLKVGDQIISIDNIKVEDSSNLPDIINKYNVDDYVNLKIIRNNKTIIQKCKIYKYDNKKIIGVGLQSYYTYNTDKKIKFKFKNNEKGPSGGLMTTLEIFNQLTKKDYTYGLKIAGTGTILEDGSIGPIGGVDYKVKGAAKKHADIFFVPEDNYKECIKTVKDKKLKIKVIKVKNIKDAIKYLKDMGDE